MTTAVEFVLKIIIKGDKSYVNVVIHGNEVISLREQFIHSVKLVYIAESILDYVWVTL
jgi:hypothetical protein